MQISVFLGKYLDYSKQVHRPVTYKNNKHIIDRFTKNFHGEIENITRMEMESYLLAIRAKAPYSAALTLRVLRAIFNKAKEWELIKKNPLKKMRLPRIPKKKPAFITQSELLELCSNVTKKEYRDIFMIAFYTGMRLGELMNLEWNHVHFGEGYLIVENTKTFQTKSGEDRKIPINLPLSYLLKNIYKEGEKYVFPRRDPNWVSAIFRQASKDANLKGIHFHSLRHSFASNLVNKGANLYHVKELLGHSDIQVTQVYAHLQKESLADTVKLLE